MALLPLNNLFTYRTHAKQIHRTKSKNTACVRATCDVYVPATRGACEAAVDSRGTEMLPRCPHDPPPTIELKSRKYSGLFP